MDLPVANTVEQLRQHLVEQGIRLAVEADVVTGLDGEQSCGVMFMVNVRRIGGVSFNPDTVPVAAAHNLMAELTNLRRMPDVPARGGKTIVTPYLR